MINDYHGMRLSSAALPQMPDDMVHYIAAPIELKMLEAGIRPQDIVMFYESLRRQEPKIHGVVVSEGVKAKDQVV